ncbi:MAG: hypothetical protein EOM78_00675 [Erysipelotrichia bacterium]|nr:hypothetical protein [Erysipelotrichia bacterium]
MTGGIVVDSNLVNISNLFTNKGVILGDVDIQNICSYALMNGIIKIELSENQNCKNDIFHISSENKVVINFEDHQKTVIVKPLSKDEREKNIGA